MADSLSERLGVLSNGAQGDFANRRDKKVQVGELLIVVLLYYTTTIMVTKFGFSSFGIIILLYYLLLVQGT